MYWEYFGFKEPPFALTPNPAFLFLSSPHQEALAHLLFAIENRVGFIELSGEVGTGKTTLVRTLLNQLDPESHRTALIFNPTVSPLGLLKEINSEFGIASGGSEIRDLHQALNLFLLDENRAGRTVVLVIDEAQNLSPEVLEQVRLISNLETESDKLIQIVLVGQPELNNLLARQELRQLDQRITVRYHLKPISFADTGDYIRHRIKFAADGREPLTFSPGALQKIFRHSKGVPRLINSVCDRAVLLAYTRESKEVSPSMAAIAIADLGKGNRSSAKAKKRAFACLALAAVVATLCALPPWRPASAGKLSEQQDKAVAQPGGEPSAALSRDTAAKALAAVPEQEDLYAAVNAILSAWQAPALHAVPGRPASLRTLARQRGLSVTRIKGNVDALARLDAPALLEIPVPGGGNRLVAITAIGKEAVTVAPAIAGHTTIAKEELGRLWPGNALILWKDFHNLASRAKHADKEGIRVLQGLLKDVGCYSGAINGRGGRNIQAAVSEFQRREQVAVDGQATGETLLRLYRRAGGFFPPGLKKS
jgi:general secretion pathway protein A